MCDILSCVPDMFSCVPDQGHGCRFDGVMQLSNFIALAVTLVLHVICIQQCLWSLCLLHHHLAVLVILISHPSASSSASNFEAF